MEKYHALNKDFETNCSDQIVSPIDCTKHIHTFKNKINELVNIQNSKARNPHDFKGILNKILMFKFFFVYINFYLIL